MKKFRIPGQLTSLNEYTSACRSNKYTGARIKKREETVIRHSIRYQCLGYRFTVPVYVRFLWVCKDSRKDRDNIAFAKKFILDAMVDERLIADDGWNSVLGFMDDFAIDKDCPHIEVEVYREDEWPFKSTSQQI